MAPNFFQNPESGFRLAVEKNRRPPLRRIFRIAIPQGGTAEFWCAREILSLLDREGLRQLMGFLDEGDPQVFMKALLLHKTIQEDTARRASLLGFALKSSNAGLRRFAAEELTHLGHDARSAIASLKNAHLDSSEDVRFWVNLALRNLGDVQTHDDLGSME